MTLVGTVRSPYEAALGGAFETLPSEVRRAHVAPLVAVGTFDVDHGSHWITPALVKLLNLPEAGRGQMVRLEVAAHGDELLWARRIGAVSLLTRQRAAGRRIVERVGLGTIVFDVAARDGALVYQQCCLRVAGLPIPRFVAPLVNARVSAAARGWHVEVRVTWRTHLVCRYAGKMAVA